ncbi:amidohydrolase [Shouchella clausii]|uniref:amidohydrolase n=1 Tax=Shouchella clausii TaxID=79880 RepID=UPI000BA55CD8|nr:amidohydrolase [Shouchella clausii]PAD91044.1 amidohydrolase [Shouchella clausii]
MDQRLFLKRYIGEHQELFRRVALAIWNYAELRFEEWESSKLLSGILEEEGFAVERGIGEMKTAFVATYGTGKPVLSFLGEFDALSELSQASGIAEQQSIVAGGAGHGCGHHLLGTASLAAALATKAYMEQHGIVGTIRYYGCPGEEGGSGKTFMAKEGAFAGTDTAISWHPGTYTSVWTAETLANIQASFAFIGRASHAAAAPHLGRSGLDAVELMNIGSNYLREHLIDEARVHYAITNAGGLSPNVVQPKAEVLYLMRAPTLEQTQAIYERVKNIAKGAALMTDTTLEIRFEKACSNFVRNYVLEDVMNEELTAAGPLSYTEKERRFAETIRQTFSKEDQEQTIVELANLVGNPKQEWLGQVRNKALIDEIIPVSRKQTLLAGSTDVGDVSWIAPTVQCYVTCFASGTAFHTWQMVSQGATTTAYKGMNHAALVMAATAVRLLHDPDLVRKAKEEWEERFANLQYVSPIPNGVKPAPISRNCS